MVIISRHKKTTVVDNHQNGGCFFSISGKFG